MASGVHWPPSPVTRAGWKCTDCGTNYSPDVEACHCSATRPSGAGLADRLLPQVITIPGGAPRNITAPACTCPSAWGAIIPPPACPAHGQTGMLRVTC